MELLAIQRCEIHGSQAMTLPVMVSIDGLPPYESELPEYNISL